MAWFSSKCTPSDPTKPCPFPLVEVKVYFQRFPGTHGGNAERGINGVDFTYETAAVRDRGRTAVDGAVVMKIRVGETRITLTIFSTTYVLTLVPTIEAVTTLKGIQWRLDILGYEPGAIDGLAGPKTDFSMLCFEANNPPLDTVGLPNGGGLPGAADQAQLTAQAGV